MSAPAPERPITALFAAPEGPLAGARRWRRFVEPLRLLRADSLDRVAPVLAEAATEAEAGRWVAGFVAYEAAPAFDSALVCGPSAGPLAWLAVFAEVEELDEEAARRWLEARLEGRRHEAGGIEGAGEWGSALAEASYRAALEEIRARIAAGDVYQVNFTFPLQEAAARSPGAAVELFLALDDAQRAPWAALIDSPDLQLCSASPELFFALDGERVVMRPMKGTAPRGRFEAEDRERAEALERSEKERAENLMIVDMVRNDLGRVARPGSVEVTELFTVERYPTVHQLTSTVQARSAASFPEIVAALFPCASVTGAPKTSAMKTIAELETAPRGVYTGAIGWLGPERQARFSVGIRTAWRASHDRAFRYGIGSGVVWDSDPEAELRECRAKARVLDEDARLPELLETLLWRPGLGYRLLERHLERMASSARFFGVPWSEAKVRAALDGAVEGSRERLRVRLLLDPVGRVRCEATPLPRRERESWRLALDPEPTPSASPWLFHKTTRRELYDRALERARALDPDCDDVLLWNERGELTESARANLVLRIDGRWWTPPVEAGLLAGTLRGWLLDRGRIAERRLLLADLDRAERLVLVNSVRGLVRTTLSRAAPGTPFTRPAAAPRRR